MLDNDPVPRAMLSVDPTFAMLKQSAPMSWVLEARRAFLGSGVAFTPEKFLYENVGDVRSTTFCPCLRSSLQQGDVRMSVHEQLLKSKLLLMDLVCIEEPCCDATW